MMQMSLTELTCSATVCGICLESSKNLSTKAVSSVLSHYQYINYLAYCMIDKSSMAIALYLQEIRKELPYDSMNQLIRVDDQNDLTSGSSGTTWKYEYDRGGNIVSKKRYPFTIGPVGTALETIPCGYGDSNWKDKMTMYNYLAISYDAMGNPTNYNSWTYTWEKGRQLKQMSDGYWNVSYKYNADGLRVEKRSRAGSSSETVTKYTLHGKNIVHLTQDNHSMHFFYDAQNRPAIVEWNNGTTTAKYAYIHNLQGDVIALIDNTGTEVVKYVYDAWGKVLSTTGTLASTLGTIQPFRYRGYVYDVETGLYYLRSRYYDSDWGRFVNADSLFHENLFRYTINNPIMLIDPSGMVSEEAEHSFYALSGAQLYPYRYNSITKTSEINFDEPLTFGHNYIIPGSFVWGRVIEEHPDYIYCFVNMHNTFDGKDRLASGAIELKSTTKELYIALYGEKTTFQMYSSSPEAEAFCEDINKYFRDQGETEYLVDFGHGFTSNTLASIRHFQRENGLTVDGKAGIETKKTLANYLARNYFPFTHDSIRDRKVEIE